MNNNEENEMTEVTCIICRRKMDMPKSFLSKGIDMNKINHICGKCSQNMTKSPNTPISGFLSDVHEQMKKMDVNNELAEKIAEELTNNNSEELIDELKNAKKASQEEIIRESFFRGAWMALFLIGNSHEENFLKKEAEKIREFQEKMNKQEGKSSK